MNGKEWLRHIDSEAVGTVFESLYGPEGVEAARSRYKALAAGLTAFAETPARGEIGFSRDNPVRDFPEAAGDLRIFSAPGRTELGGNHTDHNQGKVLAASIQLDAAAVAAPRNDGIVVFRSTGYPDVVVDLANPVGSIKPDPAEKGTTEALVRGIAAELAAQGTAVRGFIANADSTVFTGSGLSSSAAVEVLIGKIFDSLYGEGKRSGVELAKIGQKAENHYFGKPSGLMDQIACASGGAAAIDFADTDNPQVTQIEFDLASMGYALCVVNTRGSHADLTSDYAAIPNEMKAVAGFFGKTVLRECDRGGVMKNAAELRKAVGDRAVLRALHFFGENSRVDAMRAALEKANTRSGAQERQEALARYLALVTESGNSSWELLQNIYAPKNPGEQGIALALEISRNVLAGRGACRVHGGGFAGTIQAYVPLDALDAYRAELNGVFGADAVTALRIRPVGAVELRW